MADHKKIAVIVMGSCGAGIEACGELLRLQSACGVIGTTLHEVFEDNEKLRSFELISKRNYTNMPWIDPNEPVFNERKHIETCTKNRIKRRNKKRK